MIKQSRLHELLDYDPVTGAFTWRTRRDNGTFNKRFAGKIAGVIDKHSGHRKIGIDGRIFQANRLAWTYVTGRYPSRVLRHIDGDKTNDAISNLRIIADAKDSLAPNRTHRSPHLRETPGAGALKRRANARGAEAAQEIC